MKPSSERVLALLRERGQGGITDRDGLLYAHTSRLAARIHELRREGFVITTSLETRKAVRYARYRLSFDLEHGAPDGRVAPPATSGRGAVLAAEGLAAAGSRSG